MLVKPINISKVYQWLLFNLVKPRCCLCGSPAERLSGLCAGCAHALPRLAGPQCRCGLPMAGTAPNAGNNDESALAPLCGRCLTRPPPFLGVQTLWVYAAPIDQLINDWKHHRRLTAERALLHQAMATLPLLPHVDALVAMPLHWQRQARRGFNQAGRLASAVAARAQLPLLPALRQRQRHHQQGASRRARLAQRDTAFRCIAPVGGLHLLLIDDVVTTTASCRAASECLLAAGAASVSILALARTLPADLR